MLFLYCSDFSFCFRLLPLLKGHLWQLCVLAHWLLLQLPWLLHFQWGYPEIWIRIMNFHHHHWFWWTPWWVLLASLLCYGSILHLGQVHRTDCLISLRIIIPIIPLVLYRWVFLFLSCTFLQYIMVVLWCLFSHFRCWCGHSWHQWGAQLFRLAILQPSGAYQWYAYIAWCWFLTYARAALSKYGGLMLLKQLFPAFHAIYWGIQLCITYP